MKMLYITEKKVIGIDKKTGKEQRGTFGMFECPLCGEKLELKLSRGNTQKTCMACKSTKHGLTKHPLYIVHQGMKQRCENPNNRKYHIYGGKGIKVCERWQDVELFIKDNEQFYEPGLTVDRLDSNKDYEPSNVRWVSLSRNSSETTKRRPVTQLSKYPLNPKEWIEVGHYESALQAATQLGLVAAHITATCQGKRKTHGGFAWKYTNEEI